MRISAVAANVKENAIGVRTNTFIKTITNGSITGIINRTPTGIHARNRSTLRSPSRRTSPGYITLKRHSRAEGGKMDGNAASHTCQRRGTPRDQEQKLSVKNGPVQADIGSGYIHSRLPGKSLVVLIKHVPTIPLIKISDERQIRIKRLSPVRINRTNHIPVDPESH